jgi:hypothetical protein
MMATLFVVIDPNVTNGARKGRREASGSTSPKIPPISIRVIVVNLERTLTLGLKDTSALDATNFPWIRIR